MATIIHVRNRKNTSGKNSWEYYFNYDKKRYSKSGFSTKSLAKKEGETRLASLEAERIQYNDLLRRKGINDDITLREAFKQFYEINGHRYKYNTLHRMQMLEPEIEPLMELRLSELNYQNLQGYFNNRKTRGAESNKNIYKAISRVIECAVQCDQMTKNPMKNVSWGGTKMREKSEPMTNDDFLLLLSALDARIKTANNRVWKFRIKSYRMAILTGYFLGLRVGEVLGLNKDDFDLENKTVNIYKTLIYIDLRADQLFVQQSPKTENSIAEQVIPDVFIPYLKEWFEDNPFDYLCPDQNGKLIHPDCMSTYLRRTARDLGFSFHFHLLRHLYATNLYANNVDIKVAQELLRHKDVKTTLNIYTHITENDKAEKLNSVFSALPLTK